MKKERLVAAPHTFMLSVLLMISIPAAYAIMLISHQESIGAFLRVPGALQVTLLVAVIYLALLVTLFCTRYQWAAVTEICEDRVVFRALFTHRTFYYSDMHHIGVDYGLLDGRKQFWMYFSKTPIPAMYYHRINRMKPLWGDRIFEKCGIGRDEGGDGGKTLEIRGKRRLSARDRGANYQQS